MRLDKSGVIIIQKHIVIKEVAVQIREITNIQMQFSATCGGRSVAL